MSASLEAKVRETVAQTLKLPIDAVDADASADSLDAWDSLAQVNLIMSLEQTFDIELDVEAVMELTSVAAIIEHLEELDVA